MMPNDMFPSHHHIINMSFGYKSVIKILQKIAVFKFYPIKCLYFTPLNLELTMHKINPGLCVKKNIYLSEYKENQEPACIHRSLVPYKYFSLIYNISHRMHI